MPAEEGNPAPDFCLIALGGRKICLSDFRGKNDVVLYFYPRNDTPGCTAEACDFRDRNRQFEMMNAVVLGVSVDPVESHEKFAQKHALNFPLLTDPNHEAAEAYGVWVEKNMYGRKFMGVERSTFLIDKEGRIARVWRKVKVEGHAAEVAAAVKDLQSRSKSKA